MRALAYFTLLALAAALPLGFIGCKSSTDSTKNKNGDDHGHDHDHDHAHGGLFGGHILELGKEEYHAEWTDDAATGKVTVYILDSAMKKEVPIEAEKIAIKTKVGDKENTYDLEAINAAEGKASQFSTTDKTLVTILTSVGEGTTATLDVTINGKQFTQPFAAHEEHGHKH
jgi:hypothetical protein